MRQLGQRPQQRSLTRAVVAQNGVKAPRIELSGYAPQRGKASKLLHDIEHSNDSRALQTGVVHWLIANLCILPAICKGKVAFEEVWSCINGKGTASAVPQD